ncbi:heme NO-binding domain-containing protein [Litoreibacter arenae]|uniref:Heme NO-binding domain-containing protein n=1 Tax=Litoreibacter arenae DSM 19593 TaxID=1123360 RepID=S9RSG9_9RHOB|nr:heme NO-binding domain-containing protein [Litoreibacter arenae]EPX81010.1 hypothetical protein thalar_00455 [Litoreibacter arenae DSM 19593]
MYGMIHRALQCFSQDTYGDGLWQKAVADAGVPSPEFEAMLTYPDQQLDDVLNALAARLDKTPAQLCEDLGAYLVTHARMEPVRRLLRFGGATFEDFVLSLDDLHDRVKLALPDLHLPRLEVDVHSQSAFSILVNSEREGFGAVLLGILRALADDYGALAVLEHGRAAKDGLMREKITAEVFEADFTSGRGFGLVTTDIVR